MNLVWFESLASHPVVTAIGWTLMHFIWQAVAIAVLLAAVLAALKQASAQLRYAAACLGLVAMALAPLGTAIYVITSAPGDRNVALPAPDTIAESSSWARDDVTLSIEATAAANPSRSPENTMAKSNGNKVPAPMSEGDSRPAGTLLADWLKGYLPWCVALWTIGVAALAIRLLTGLGRIGRWRRESVEIIDARVTAAFARLLEQMRIAPRVGLRASVRTSAPAVIGWIKPVILIPPSMLTGLTPFELESILAHELAHVRRLDYLVNLLQAAVETVLFYHPAIWWLSNRVRAERENCCDDLAAEVCGNRLAFARALARMEELRCGQNELVLAANGSSLVRRIRRLVAEPNPPAICWWPAGVGALTVVMLLLCGLCLSTLSAHGPRAGDEAQAAILETQPRQQTAAAGKDYPKRKAEVIKTDSKTGIEKSVFADIRLFAGTGAAQREVSLDMMYSNVMPYTFIPASVAEELGAVALGEIDFGDKPPPRPKAFQTMLDPDAEKDAEKVKIDPNAAAHATGSATVTVKEVSRPVSDGTKIVPYGSHVIWVPDHLGFYGVNKTGQRVFKVVRLDKVDLGVGPSFGPINALVLNEENSEFGVLGRDWASKPRGEKGESLWHAAEGVFFMAGPRASSPKRPAPPPVKPPGSGEVATARQGTVTAESNWRDEGPDRLERPGIKVLATHTYNQSRRESTGWVEHRGANVPVDIGVEHNGVIVYETLFFDIIAVDAETRKALWKVGGGKSEPFWKTVSIVEFQLDGERQIAVELFAVDHGTRELIYRYVSLDKGEQLAPPDPNDPSDEPPPQIVSANMDGDRTTRAVTHASAHGRSPAELLKHFFIVIERNMELAGSITNRETIVSAQDPNYLLHDALEASEIFFNLPEGSGLRAEFSGKRVEIEERDVDVRVVVTDGKLDLIDAGGVIRATASPDGGAEQLVVVCRTENGETVMVLSTQRIVDSPDYPHPPVQVKMNPRTGAPEDEEDLPHGAVRYEIEQHEEESTKPVRMKMTWWYELRRLAEEAEAQTGTPWEELIFGGDPAPEDPTELAPERESSAQAWGPKPEKGDLRLRLTLLDEDSTVGKPLRLKLEIKNFGDQPQSFDPQYYAEFRVLKVMRDNGEPDLFIGMTPQTSGGQMELAPGETFLLWENSDASALYMLDEGDFEIFVAAPRNGGAHYPGSNKISVTMLAGEQPPLKRLLRNLNRELPKDWEVSNGWGAVYLTHTPTSLKRDASSVQIWFTDDSLAEDFQLGESDRRQIVSSLGPCELGHFNVGADQRAVRLWPDYLQYIRDAAGSSLEFRQDATQNVDEDDNQAEKLPWSVHGKVTDAAGKPINGAEVRAHCGAGTLRQTGSAVTDAEGRYEFRFGPGVWFKDRGGIQAATISVHLGGHFEKNMHRQGDKVAAYELPDGEIGWGGKMPDDVFLPGKSKQIDFVMMPAATLRGMVIDKDGKRIEGMRVSITGDKLPPSSSVIDEVRTDAEGKFAISDIPTGFQFQIMVEPVKAEPPWLAWASAPVVFATGETDDTYLEYSVDGKPVEFSCQQLYLLLHGDGVNWKTALKEGAQRPLKLTWDGLSTETAVHAGMAFLELGSADKSSPQQPDLTANVELVNWKLDRNPDHDELQFKLEIFQFDGDRDKISDNVPKEAWFKVELYYREALESESTPWGNAILSIGPFQNGEGDQNWDWIDNRPDEDFFLGDHDGDRNGRTYYQWQLKLGEDDTTPHFAEWEMKARVLIDLDGAGAAHDWQPLGEAIGSPTHVD